MQVRATQKPVGADVTGVDVRHLSDDAFAAIHAVWLQHHVLRFRDQQVRTR
jgi:alpha-ketoglutarate-dependent taurine dioxygenase